jgi:hypothetical protein
MADVVDIISAIEQYLAKSGKGNSYLADKITEIFEADNSPFNNNGTILSDLRTNIIELNKSMGKTEKKMNSLSSTIQTFITKIKNVKLPDSKNFKLPNLTPFDKLAKKVDAFKLPDLKGVQSINSKLKDFGDNLDKFQQNVKNLTQNKEKAVKEKTVIDVNVDSFSNSAIKSLVEKMKEKISSPDNRKVNVKSFNVNTQEEKESGGIIGKIIKTVFGGIALLAGIGFIAKFLETPQGKKTKEFVIQKFQDFLKFAEPFLNNTFKFIKEKFNDLYNFLKPLVERGVKEVYSAGKSFIENTFKFFDLKDILGPKFEGISVLLTKSIFYGVTKIGSSILNFFSFGVFGQIQNLLYKPFEILGNLMTKFGDNILNVISKMTTNSGVIGKAIGATTKLFSGGLLKLFGGGLIRRIPIIGSFISFKDAYDRFQKGDYVGGFLSFGSGLANFIPGIGTAISIGIDLLNSFIDYKTEGSSQTKMAAIGDFIGGLKDKLWNGIKNVFEDLINTLNPVNWFKSDSTDTRSWWEKVKSGASSLFGSDAPTPPTPTPPPTNTVQPQANNQQKISDSIYKVNEQETQTMLTTNKEIQELNNKFDQWISLLGDGFSVLTSATVQGSQSVTQAIISTSGQGSPASPSYVGPSVDPINQFRVRAQRAIEYPAR